MTKRIRVWTVTALFLAPLAILLWRQTIAHHEQNRVDSLLVHAISDYDNTAVEEALKKGANSDCLISESGKLPTRPVLLSKQWFLTILHLKRLPPDDGYTVLMQAVERNDPELVRLLLKWRASPNLKTSRPVWPDPGGHNDPPEEGTLGGYTALALACRHGNVECVRLLLEAGADPNIARSDGQKPIQLLDTRGYGSLGGLGPDPTEEANRIRVPKENAAIKKLLIASGAN